FGFYLLVGFADLIYFIVLKESFLFNSVTSPPSNTFAAHVDGLYSPNSFGTIFFASSVLFTLCFAFFYLIRFLRSRQSEVLLIVGVICNILFMINDVVSTFDVLPLIPIFALAVIPEATHIDRLIVKRLRGDKVFLQEK